jgi:hypothetical protein
VKTNVKKMVNAHVEWPGGDVIYVESVTVRHTGYDVVMRNSLISLESELKGEGMRTFGRIVQTVRVMGISDFTHNGASLFYEAIERERLKSERAAIQSGRAVQGAWLR